MSYFDYLQAEVDKGNMTDVEMNKAIKDFKRGERSGTRGLAHKRQGRSRGHMYDENANSLRCK